MDGCTTGRQVRDGVYDEQDPNREHRRKCPALDGISFGVSRIASPVSGKGRGGDACVSVGAVVVGGTAWCGKVVCRIGGSIVSCMGEYFFFCNTGTGDWMGRPAGVV